MAAVPALTARENSQDNSMARSSSKKQRLTLLACCFRPQADLDTTDAASTPTGTDTWVETNTWVKSDGKAELLTSPKKRTDQLAVLPHWRHMPATAMSYMGQGKIYSDQDWHNMLSYIAEHGNESLHPDHFTECLSNFSEASHSSVGSDVATTPYAPTPRIPRAITFGNAFAPKEPLVFGEKHWQYKPVDCKRFIGYWAKQHSVSTPAPFPIDTTLGFSMIAKKVHESIPGLMLRESSCRKQLEMVAAPSWIPPIPGFDAYCEYFNLDGRDSAWNMRRDLKLGRHIGQLYQTTDDILIMRVWAYGLFSNKVEWVGEDYMRLEDDGKTIVVRLCAKHLQTHKQDHFYLVGSYMGPVKP